MKPVALPFLVAPKTEIVPIGDESTGVLYLEKKGDISPAENPVDLQKEGTRAARIQLILDRATRALMAKEGIKDYGAAYLRLMGADTKNVDSDSGGLTMYSYLSREEVEEMLSLRENRHEIAIKAATAMIRYRVAYPVKITADANPKKGATSASLEVEPLSFPLAKGDKIRVKYRVLTVAEYAEDGSEVLQVESLPEPIKADSVGYVLNEKGKFMIGNPDWTEEHTNEFLSESLISLLYAFYQEESIGAVVNKEEPTEETGKNLLTEASSKPSPDESPSTGEQSSGESNLAA